MTDQQRWIKKTADFESVYLIVRNMNVKEISREIFLYRQIWLRSQLEQLKLPWQDGSDLIKVDPQNALKSFMLNDQFNQINYRKEIKIQFEGEKVQDAGGLLREFTMLLLKQIFDPKLGLFDRTDSKDTTYKLNDNLIEQIDEEKLKICQLLGYIIAKCILEKIPLNINFSTIILKHFIGSNFSIDDFKYYKDDLYTQLQYLTSNILDQNTCLEMFFQAQVKQTHIDEKGKLCSNIKQFELKPNGENIQITESNKQEFIDLCIDFYCQKAHKPYLQIIKNSIQSIIPLKLFEIFNKDELNIIICGLPFIDVQDWKENTQYKGIYNKDHQVILWFWQWVETLNLNELQELLQFSTGSSRTPLEGFSKLESNRNQLALFTIESIEYSEKQQYPKAHTCFNRLDLPIYDNELTMRENLNYILNSQLQGVYGTD